LTALKASPIAASVRELAAASAFAIAMRPAIDGDAQDIALIVETGRAENPRQLIPNVMFESRERRGQHPLPADTMLFTSR
jgi:hypothetical protein